MAVRQPVVAGRILRCRVISLTSQNSAFLWLSRQTHGNLQMRMCKVELSCRNPIVELRAFANRNFALGCLFSFTIGVGLYGSVYLLPLFLGRVRGMNSLDIGQVMIVTGAFQF